MLSSSIWNGGVSELFGQHFDHAGRQIRILCARRTHAHTALDFQYELGTYFFR